MGRNFHESLEATGNAPQLSNIYFFIIHNKRILEAQMRMFEVTVNL
jgi:hypothetical protein